VGNLAQRAEKEMKIIKLTDRNVLKKLDGCTHALKISLDDDKADKIWRIISKPNFVSTVHTRYTKRLVVSPDPTHGREYKFNVWFGVKDETVITQILLMLQ
jgi:hypothetical protein